MVNGVFGLVIMDFWVELIFLVVLGWILCFWGVAKRCKGQILCQLRDVLLDLNCVVQRNIGSRRERQLLKSNFLLHETHHFHFRRPNR